MDTMNNRTFTFFLFSTFRRLGVAKLLNKKTVFGVLLFILLIFIFPLIQSLLFASRSSGKIEINKEITAPYLKSSQEGLMLVFYGYVGCAKVCTPILHQLDEIYGSKEFEPFRDNVGLKFVNLMPDLEPDQPALFAKSFNPRFSGIYLSQKELMGIDRELGVFFSKSIGNDTQIDHSDNLYLVEKEKGGRLVLKSIYFMHPLNREMLINDLSELGKVKQ